MPFPDPLASYIPLRSLHKRQLRVVAALFLDPLQPNNSLFLGISQWSRFTLASIFQRSS